MQLEERINAFALLGKKMEGLSPADLDELFDNAYVQNKWFTRENIATSMAGIARFLDHDTLKKWIGSYNIGGLRDIQVGIVMAGNIPLVGFHDFLSVLISGLKVAIKPSSEDTYLINTVVNWLTTIEPRFASRIDFPETLKEIDAVIATGSDNSARYFEYYFGKKPNVIRKNRTSVAILDGTESTDQMQNLGKDIFTYFGLGCRNVSKIFYPENFDIRALFPQFEGFSELINHNKYVNNYEYNKSILLVNGEAHLDTGFLLTKEDENLVSPISVVYLEKYTSAPALKNKISDLSDKIQCIATESEAFMDLPNQVVFGDTQCPDVSDYADGVDTLLFLTELDQ